MEGRSRGEGVAVMSASERDSLQGREPVKTCTFSGCVGTMRSILVRGRRRGSTRWSGPGTRHGSANRIPPTSGSPALRRRRRWRATLGGADMTNRNIVTSSSGRPPRQRVDHAGDGAIRWDLRRLGGTG